jgi:hypothetical protein
LEGLQKYEGNKLCQRSWCKCWKNSIRMGN